MSVLLLTMGPQLSISMSAPNLSIGSPGTIVLRAVGAAGSVAWTLLSSDLPSPEWDSALTPSGATATLNAAAILTPGVYTFRVRAVDSFRQPVEAEFSVRIQDLPITITGSLSAWTVGVAASDDLAVAGGSGIYVAAGISSGSLPAGMSVSLIGSTLRVSGTPGAVGSGSVTLWVRDSDDAEAMIALVWEATANVDPHWANVVALMHFDGPNNSTAMTDETGRSWSANGNAKLSTAQSRWGVSSLDLDGSGDYLTTADSPALSLSGQDATIELSLRLRSIKTVDTLVTKRPATGATNEFSLVLGSGVPTIVAWDVSGALVLNLISSDPPLLTNVWYDIALSIVGTTWRLFVDGKKVAEGSPSGPEGTNNQPVHLGHDPTNSSRNPDAYIDEFRWTRGVGRYTSNYTPATGPFPSVGP